MSVETETDQRVAKLVDEATVLRGSIVLVDPQAPMASIMDALMDVRQRLDRVENLLTESLRIRLVGRIILDHTRAEADDAWDVATVKARNAAARDEFSSAKERAARSNLEVLELRRSERRQVDSVARYDSAVETIKIKMRGLADIRQDILTIIKGKQFESTLDR